MSRQGPIRTSCALFLACCLTETGLVRAEGFPADLVSPGLLASDLMVGDKRMSGYIVTAADDTRVFALQADGSIARINPGLGTVEILQKSGWDLTKPELDLEGNFLLLSSKSSDWINSISVESIHLDVMDLTSGTWKGRKSAVVPGSPGERMRSSLYKDEFRITLDSGKILRWRTSDMAALPTLAIPAGQLPYSNSLTAIFATPVGSEFCVGITHDKQLVFERDGIFRQQGLPRMYQTYQKTWNSAQFIAVPVSNEGIFIWDKSKISQAPRFITPPWGFDPAHTLWNDRFLLSVAKIVNSEEDRQLIITDVGAPASAIPLTIPLPPDFNVGKRIGISGGYFWSLALGDIYVLPDPSIKQLLRIPVAATNQMLAVDVAPARAFESEGHLRFPVTADRPLTGPVTVDFRTVPGSAREGVDYVKYQGSVTLTPAQPTAQVVVELLPDQEVESYESLILEVTGVSGGAWRKRLFTTGVIEGSGFQRLNDIPAPPKNGIAGAYMSERILTEAGLVARFSIDNTSSAFFIYRNGGTSWERLEALGTVPGWHDAGSKRIIDTQGNRIVVALDRAQPGAMEAYSLAVLDLKTHEILKSADSGGRKAWLHPQGLVVPYFPLENLPFANGGTGWTLPEPQQGSTSYFGFSETHFVRDNSVLGCQLIRFSDGTVAGDFPPLRPDSGNGDFVLALNNRSYQNRHGVILNSSGTGYPCHPFAIESATGIDDPGVLMERGIVLSQKPASGQSVYQAIDGTTGAVLTTLSTDFPGESISGSSGILAFPLQADTTGLLDTNAHLPALRELQVTRNEEYDPDSWMLNLSEAAPFPIVASVSSSSGEVSPTSASVIIPAGATSVPFPVSVVDDQIPEPDGTIPLTVTLAANGNNRTSSMTVTIRSNDFHYLPKPDYAAEGTSIAVHPQGVVFGNGINRVAAEVRHKKVVTLPIAKSSASFGHAVGLSKKYLVVGAPLLSYSVGNPSPLLTSFVFVYDRKTGKLVSQHNDPTRGSAFGSVLHVTESRFFVGAPAISRGGVATGYAFGKTNPQRYKHPDAKVKAARFGTSIVSDGKSVWIGAPGDGPGKVFQYDVSSGKLRKTIRPPAGAGGNFGQAMVSIGSGIAISAPVKGGAAAVFVYNATSGKLLKTIPTPFADGGLFGASLAVVDRRFLAVGCPTSKFSPAGGVMLYDLSGTGYRLITMLLPPRKSTDPDSRQLLKNLGMAAGLTGADGILGVTSLNAKDLLDVTESRRSEDWPVPPTISLLDLTKFLPSMTRMAAVSAPYGMTGTPWETALGAGATADTCKLVLKSNGSSMSLLLPEIDRLAPGTQLVLERSDDLNQWTAIACLSDGGGEGWQPVGATGEIQPGATSLPILSGSGAMFYRIRCDAP